jgi:hypothetical protein
LKHLPFETLIAYLEHDLDSQSYASVEQHVRDCADCQKLLDAARLLSQQVNESSLEEPRPRLIQRAVAAFRRSQLRAENPSEPPVSLLFDSWDSSLATGTRGHTEDRQLLFQVGAFDVDLQLMYDAQTKSHKIYGQLLSEAASQATLEGSAVRLQEIDSEQNLRLTMIDELGRFNFSLVPSANYTLQIDLSDSNIRIGTVVLAPHHSA